MIRSTLLRGALLVVAAGAGGACRASMIPPAEVVHVAAVDSAVFVTRLGSDTLVIERMVRTPARVETEVLMRTPVTSRTRWVMELDAAGAMTRLQSIPLDVRTGTPLASGGQTIVRTGDSLRITSVSQQGTSRTTSAAAAPATLPFIDMVHWPFEVALVRARGTGAATVQQPLLTGSRTSNFVIGRVGADSMTIRHPSRGTMRARVDAHGRLLGLDAGETTRKLVVERKPWIALDQVAARWAAADAAGRTAGALSGRDTARATVGGANLLVDYGTPWKRGREIWGALVRFGEVWRTGANMATHFSTSRDLLLGRGADTLRVPAGSYTLFSVPAADGGLLIVNRQTGQTGTAHDAARDLGRVRMVPRPLPSTVERFTIRVTDDDGSGAIRLQWDDTEYVVPFAVR